MSAAIDRDREKGLLARYRDYADRLAGDDWGMVAEGGAVRLTSTRSTGETVTLCTFHADCLPIEQDIICSAFQILRMIVDFERRASGVIRQLQEAIAGFERRAREKNFSAQAAMLLDDAVFRRFLETKGGGGPVRDSQAADTRLKSLLAIKSKADINADDRAKRAFLALRADFKTWKRGGP